MCKVTLNRKSQGQGHTERLQLSSLTEIRLVIKVYSPASIKSVLINVTENELKRRGQPNV